MKPTQRRPASAFDIAPSAFDFEKPSRPANRRIKSSGKPAAGDNGESDRVTAWRGSLYERAQTVVLAELTRRTPRPSALQIDEEFRSLAKAIQRIESEFSLMLDEDGFARSRDILLKVLAGMPQKNCRRENCLRAAILLSGGSSNCSSNRERILVVSRY